MVIMPSRRSPEETVGSELTVYDTGITPHPQWEFSEFINPLASLGADQDELHITTLPRHNCLPQAPLSLYTESSSASNWGHANYSIQDQALLPRPPATFYQKPSSALIPELPSSVELHKEPSRKRKANLDEPKTLRSAGWNARGGTDSNDHRRKRTVAEAKVANANDNISNRKHEKRKQVQQSNLIAAKKCRLRKKEDLMRLQSDEQELQERHRMLSSYVEELKEEILYLKMQVLQHSSCECTPIHRYIEKEAQSYIDGLSPRWTT